MDGLQMRRTQDQLRQLHVQGQGLWQPGIRVALGRTASATSSSNSSRPLWDSQTAAATTAPPRLPMRSLRAVSCFASLHFPGFGHQQQHEAPKPALQPLAVRTRKICGTWVKVKEYSDSMTPAMDLMQLGGVVRQAVKLVRGLKIDQDETTWNMSVFSVIAWFKVTERYGLDGSNSECKRRDLRRGKHSGHLVRDKEGPHGGVLLQLSWDEPHGGMGNDEFVVVPTGTAAAEARARAAAAEVVAHAGVADPAIKAAAHAASVLERPTVAAAGAQAADADELHVYSTIHAKGTVLQYRQVYHRKA